ncbi:HNH endonuclease [Paenibacillus sp. FSL K6-0108]|uniref:HNH endonuclease n=1 Tax=Paenibacillus sp. FSL K6-0108 TaxID=2921417 RepID=UPI003252F89D
MKPVEIEVTIPKKPQADFKKANLEAGLNKDSDPPVPELNQPPKGYTWYHHEDGKTMVLVQKGISIGILGILVVSLQLMAKMIIRENKHGNYL